MAAIAGLALVVTACGTTTPGWDVEPSERFIHVQVTEFDARRTLDQDPFPQETLDQWPEYFGEDGRGGAGGYYLFMSDEDEWRIGSYVFLPSQITLIQGDRVTMELFAVRGSEHLIVLRGPGLEPRQIDMKRGELHQVEFTVNEPGLYQLLCTTHPPTQAADILVLPSRT